MRDFDEQRAVVVWKTLPELPKIQNMLVCKVSQRLRQTVFESSLH